MAFHCHWPIVLLLSSVATLSQAFVRYALVNESWSQWQGNQVCQSKGYDGLAVIDTPVKWKFAQVLLDSQNLPTNQQVWIGLEYNTVLGEARWRGDQNYTWGAWASNQPDWSKTRVLVARDGGSYEWKTQGSNYENLILCDHQFGSLKMTRHPNRNVDLNAAAVVLSESATSAEDCSMLCVSASPCTYFTFAAATSSCKMYSDAAVDSLLAVDSGTPSTFLLFHLAFN